MCRIDEGLARYKKRYRKTEPRDYADHKEFPFRHPPGKREAQLVREIAECKDARFPGG